jgi:rusticyanin
MNHARYALGIGTAAVMVAAGVGAGVAYANRGGSPSTSAATSTAAESSHMYYRSMMGGFANTSMMGGSNGWTTGDAGYGWMMGGVNAPGWMHGGALPGFMMGTSTDPGKVMGALFADAPGPRVSPTQATRRGTQIPAGATVDAAHNRITFSGSSAHLVVLASPSAGPDETFLAAGLVNPTIAVRAGSRVSIQVINADPDTSHGLVVTATGSAASWMPMMTSSPAFSGSALWFLGNPTSAGMHTGTITFTAATPGTYQYLCAVPGHAQKGMVGTFIVTG